MMETQPTDREVLRHIKKGDIDWYGVIVKRYTGRIYQYVCSRLFDKSEADDMVQKAFIQFYRAIDRFDDSRDVLPYLYEIAKNELKMFYRAHKDTVALTDQVGSIPASEVNATDVNDLLQGVAPEQRKALRMVYEGYTYREIAAALKRPVNTVRTLIRRARQLLIVKKQ